jgi:hypothetical protein
MITGAARAPKSLAQCVDLVVAGHYRQAKKNRPQGDRFSSEAATSKDQ